MQPFGHNRCGPKIAGLRPFRVGGWVPITQSLLGWGIPPYQVPSWCIQMFGHNKDGPKIWPKIGGSTPPFGEGQQGPYLTQSRLGWGLAPYQVTSWSMQPFGRNRYGPKIGGPNCLATIHQRHRQDRTDRQDRQRSDAIGRTVLQMVAQKCNTSFSGQSTYFLNLSYHTTKQTNNRGENSASVFYYSMHLYFRTVFNRTQSVTL